MQISKVDETYCVLRYTIWQVEHTSKTILKHVVYVPLGCLFNNFGSLFRIISKCLEH